MSNDVPRKRIRVLLVDDHPVVRKGLSLIIERESDLTVCGEAEDAPTAILLTQTRKPNVVILDISLKGGNGLDLLKDLLAVSPNLAVIVLSIHDENVYAERALRAGARGYIMKQEATEKVLTAVRRILTGDICVSNNIHNRLLRNNGKAKETGISPVERLSDRELEVFELIGKGMTTQQIAKHLNLSIKTIETHNSRIKVKLGLKNHIELLQHATLWSSKEEK